MYVWNTLIITSSFQEDYISDSIDNATIDLLNFLGSND